jgi:hypothetical protein
MVSDNASGNAIQQIAAEHNDYADERAGGEDVLQAVL